MEGMPDWVWCFVEIRSSIIFFLDVRVDVAPLLVVAMSIQRIHAEEWVARLVRKLLCDTPLVCTLHPIAEQIGRALLRELGIASPRHCDRRLQELGITPRTRHCYEWYAIEMHLLDVMCHRIELDMRPPAYVDLYDMLEEGVPWLQRLRERWSRRLRVALGRRLRGDFKCYGIIVDIRADRLGFTRGEPWQLGAARTVCDACRRHVVGSIDAMRVTPLCSLAAVASGLVATEVLGWTPLFLFDGDGVAARLSLPRPNNNPAAS